ncbi:MAG: tetratricopeptide repeat protein [Planctomycetes bacterium]|nr:tetratricopeptide repeat protein [Planctomycetota bacterium]
MLLVLLVLAVWWPALRGELVYDDTLNFTNNEALRSFDVGSLLTKPFFREHLHYWRPLGSLLMAIGYRGGPVGVHVIALAVHAATVAVAFALLRRWLVRPTAAWLAAALFAVHPVHAEKLCWASALPGGIAVLCTLLALDAQLRWLERGAARVPWTIGAWLLLALLAKENAIVAPLLFAAAWFAQPARTARAAVRLAGATSIAAGLWFTMRMLVFAGAPATDPTNTIGAVGYAAGAAEVWLRQLELLLAPYPLTPFRSLLGTAPGASASIGLAFVGGAALALSAAAVVARRLPATLRAPLALLLLPPLLPALAHPWLGDFVLQDRHLSLPALGMAALTVVALRRLRGAAVLATIGFAVMAFTQCDVWRDQANLIDNGLRHAPGRAQVQVMAGNLLLRRAEAGEPAQLGPARERFALSLELLRQQDRTGTRLEAAARVGLGWCELREWQAAGRGPAVITEFERAALIDDQQVGAWVGIGTGKAMSGEHAAAEAAFRRALQLDRGCVEAWFNLGYLQFETGRRDEARRSLEQALRLAPDLAPARQMLEQLR